MSTTHCATRTTIWTNAYWSTTNLPWLINHVPPTAAATQRGCGARLTMEGSVWLHGGAPRAGAGAIIGWRLSASDHPGSVFGRRELGTWKDERARLLMTGVALLLAAVLGQRLVCGALSGPFARYQARITWLVSLGYRAFGRFRSVGPGQGWCVPVTWATRLLRLARWCSGVRASVRFWSFIRFGMVGTAGFIVHAFGAPI